MQRKYGKDAEEGLKGFRGNGVGRQGKDARREMRKRQKDWEAEAE